MEEINNPKNHDTTLLDARSKYAEAFWNTRAGFWDTIVTDCNSYLEKETNASFQIPAKRTLSDALNNLGFIYKYKGNIVLALEYLHESLRISESIDHKAGIAPTLNTIGQIYRHQGDLEKAFSIYKRGLKIEREIDDKVGVARSLNNIGVVYKYKGDLDSALHYLHLGLEGRLTIGANTAADSYDNIAMVYKQQKLYDKSLEYLFKALKIEQDTKYKLGEIQTTNNIAWVYLETNKNSSAIKYANKSLEMAQKSNLPEYIRDAAEVLSIVHEKQGASKKSLEMYKLYISMKDSTHNKATQKASAQQQARYEYEKQKAIDDAEHDKVLAIEFEEKEKQKILTGATATGLGLVIIFLIFVFNRLRATRKQKKIIEEQKLAVEKQKTIVEEAHSELEEKNKEIMDSITYAKRIQSAILPPNKVVKEYLQESFILYKPKDIVAGDFYWMESIYHNEPVELSTNETSLRGIKQSPENKQIASLHKSSVRNDETTVLFAAADCTGHGVPGAMVSVICNNALNRSVREHGLTDSGEILTKTRKIVIQEFEKSDEEVKDGMDIALCSLTGNKLEYAGANNPLWIVRNGEIIETKANKQPIGKCDNPVPYTTHTFELQKNDAFYIFSDGYVDQFGGEKGKKFKAKAFRSLLLSIQNKTMEEQKQIINSNFENWKGNLEQIDDVCVIGVSI